MGGTGSKRQPGSDSTSTTLPLDYCHLHFIHPNLIPIRPFTSCRMFFPKSLHFLPLPLLITQKSSHSANIQPLVCGSFCSLPRYSTHLILRWKYFPKISLLFSLCKWLSSITVPLMTLFPHTSLWVTCKKISASPQIKAVFPRNMTVIEIWECKTPADLHTENSFHLVTYKCSRINGSVI